MDSHHIDVAIVLLLLQVVCCHHFATTSTTIRLTSSGVLFDSLFFLSVAVQVAVYHRSQWMVHICSDSVFQCIFSLLLESTFRWKWKKCSTCQTWLGNHWNVKIYSMCVCVWQIKATSKNRKTKSTHSERSDECFVNQTNYSKSRTNEVEIYRLSRHFCHTEFNTC